MNTVSAPDSATRIYRIGWGPRALCVVFTAFATVFLISVLWGVYFGGREADFWTMFVGFVLVAVGTMLTAEKFTTTVTLTENEIRLRSGFGERKLPLDKIRGKRRYYDPGGDETPGEWRLKIVSDDDRYPTLDFDERYTFDETFHEWFLGLRDLDETDKTAPKPSNFGLV